MARLSSKDSNRIFLIATGLVALLMVFLLPQNGSPVRFVSQQPTPSGIAWSATTGVSETLFPGTSKAVTVKFRSNQNIDNVGVSITPSLDGIVSVDPTQFASLVANRDYAI